MKKQYFMRCFLVCTVLACRYKETDQVTVNAKTFMIDSEKHEVDSLLIGEKDTAFVVKNKVDQKDVGTDRAHYEINIIFSNKKWPLLTYKNAIGADLYVVEDISGDGKPELLLRPEWFNQCWSTINLFSIKDNSWKLIKRGEMYFCADKYPLPLRIEEKDKKHYLITDTIVNDKFVIDKKEIQF